MPKIIITRKKNWWIRDKIFEVFLDGQRLGYLSNGESKEFEVPARDYKLKVNMGRFGSKDLSFNMYNKEVRTFIVSRNNIKAAMIKLDLLFVFLSAYIYKMFFVHPTLIIFTLFITPLFLLVLYIGTNKHLKITEGARERTNEL